MQNNVIVCSMSNLKCELVLLENFDKERFNRAYIAAIDLLISNEGDKERILTEYEYFKRLIC